MNESESRRIASSWRTSPYNASVVWAASFLRSDRPKRRNIHMRMNAEMEHQKRDAVRMMQRFGITDYRITMEWTTDNMFGSDVHWLTIHVEYYDAAIEQQQEGDND